MVSTNKDHNGAFIAHARTDIPALIDSHRALVAKLRKIEDMTHFGVDEEDTIDLSQLCEEINTIARRAANEEGK